MPSIIDPSAIAQSLTVRMRVAGIMKNKQLSVYINGQRALSRPRPVMTPGEMEQIVLTKKLMDSYESINSILICAEDREDK